MAWVYILQGKSGRHYIGSTSDWNRRWAEHQVGKCHTTRRLGFPLTVVALRETLTLLEARKLERFLKTKKDINRVFHYLRE